MHNVRAVVRQIAKSWALNGWKDRDGAMLVAAEQLRQGRTPSSIVGQLPANFYASNQATRKQVADSLSDILINTGVTVNDTPINLLFVSAGPQDQGRLRLDAELRDIMGKIKAAHHRDKFSVSIVPAARRTDLIDAFNEFHPVILHVSGHGDTNTIVLEDDNGKTAEVGMQLLMDLIAVAGNQLKIVVLNACDSAALARNATGLVDIAIGMNASVGDDAARAFAVQLYSSLGAGVPLKRAFDQAKVAISANGSTGSDIPELYARKNIDINTYTVMSA